MFLNSMEMSQSAHKGKVLAFWGMFIYEVCVWRWKGSFEVILVGIVIKIDGYLRDTWIMYVKFIFLLQRCGKWNNNWSSTLWIHLCHYESLRKWLGYKQTMNCSWKSFLKNFHWSVSSPLLPVFCQRFKRNSCALFKRLYCFFGLGTRWLFPKWLKHEMTERRKD